MLENVLRKLYAKRSLRTGEAQYLFDVIMSGSGDPLVVASVLTVLSMRGETVEELCGAASSVLKVAKKFPRPSYKFCDIVGTGGDAYNTINVSTISAIVATACGVKICKHGNRKVTSQVGAADVLSTLGMNPVASPEASRALLNHIGFCFLMAPHYHPSFKHVVPIRRALPIRTIFSVLGPVVNPSRPDYIVNGVFHKKLLDVVALTHAYLGVEKATVVHGSGMDEVCLHGPTEIVEISKGGNMERWTLLPSDFGLRAQPIESIKGGNPEYNAKVVANICGGVGKQAHENIIAANVAVLLRTAGVQEDVKAGVGIAKQAMHDGSARKVIENLKNANA